MREKERKNNFEIVKKIFEKLKINDNLKKFCFGNKNKQVVESILIGKDNPENLNKIYCLNK